MELLLLLVPILTFVLGTVVGAGGTVLYMKRKMQKAMQMQFDEAEGLGAAFDG